MRYLVTGGAGFIGSHLVETLVARGDDVRVLDDLSTGHLSNLSTVRDQIELIEGSITDPDVCVRAAQGVDYVLHQAALPSVPRSLENPVATHEICATGTLNVLIAARDAGVRRMVYAGSSSAYGNTAILPKRESMTPQPRSPYAVAKLTGEHYSRVFATAYGFETVVLRYFNIFGPKQDPNSPYGAAVPKFIAAALEGNAPTIHGDGEQTRDFTFVENAVRANLLACEAGSSAVGKTFNIGCAERISVKQLWGLIRELSGSSVEPQYVASRAGDVRDSLAALDEAREHLGYEPVVDVRTGLQRTVESFSSVGHPAAPPRAGD